MELNEKLIIEIKTNSIYRLEENLRMNTKLVEIPKGIVDKVRKKTNYFYKKKVYENKVKDGRKAKTKSFLSRNNKDS